MDGLETVVDEPIEQELEIEQPEGETEEPAESAETQEQPEGASNPYTTQFSREMRAAVRELAQLHPDKAKYLKHLGEQHARQFALTQIDPKGIDGVREKYAMLDGLVRGDVKGVDALTAIQEELAGVEEVDNLLASGDPRAFDALGEDFNAGLAKLAPAYLQRVGSIDPEGLSSALAPYYAREQSQLVREYNALIEVLDAQNDPRFDDATKMSFARAQLAKMGEWMNRLYDQNGKLKAGEFKPAQQGSQGDPLQDQRTKLERDQQTFHWDTKIQPLAAQHENQTFDNLLKPYQTRLKLDASAMEDLKQAFKAGMNRAGSADADYMRQMKIYRGQKNPDPQAVANFVKNGINKHSKNVMEQIVKARYGAFLAGKPKGAAPKPANGRPTGPVAPNVEVRTVKPPMNEIDHKRTPIEWLAQKKYYLTSGKIIQVRSN